MRSRSPSASPPAGVSHRLNRCRRRTDQPLTSPRDLGAARSSDEHPGNLKGRNNHLDRRRTTLPSRRRSRATCVPAEARSIASPAPPRAPKHSPRHEFARRDQQVALVVSDHRMPERTGIELLEQAKDIAIGEIENSTVSGRSSPSRARVTMSRPRLSTVALLAPGIGHCGALRQRWPGRRRGGRITHAGPTRTPRPVTHYPM